MNKQTSIQLKDALFLGFCAVFIVFTKAALRLNLNISGHSMFFTAFFLILSRGCVQWKFSASITGLLAGLMSIILGLGKGGPLLLIKFIMPSMVIDLCAFFIPFMFSSIVLCIIVGALASATKFFSTYLIDLLMGMDKDILFFHALTKSGLNIVFGVCGSLMVPPVIKKLKAFGAIQ